MRCTTCNDTPVASTFVEHTEQAEPHTKIEIRRLSFLKTLTVYEYSDRCTIHFCSTASTDTPARKFWGEKILTSRKKNRLARTRLLLNLSANPALRRGEIVRSAFSAFPRANVHRNDAVGPFCRRDLKASAPVPISLRNGLSKEAQKSKSGGAERAAPQAWTRYNWADVFRRNTDGHFSRPLSVMAGLEPAIQIFLARGRSPTGWPPRWAAMTKLIE